MKFLNKPVPLDWIVRTDAKNGSQYFETKREAQRAARALKRMGHSAEIVHKPGAAERIGFLW